MATFTGVQLHPQPLEHYTGSMTMVPWTSLNHIGVAVGSAFPSDPGEPTPSPAPATPTTGQIWPRPTETAAGGASSGAIVRTGIRHADRRSKITYLPTYGDRS